MSNIWQGLTGIFTKPGGGADWGRIFGVGAGATGLISNILAQRKQNRLVDDYIKRRKSLSDITPEQHLAGIRSFTRPLSGGLTAGVENLVQAAMGERGLAQAPGIMSEVLAQALAPYVQQNQDRGIDAYFRSLGLGDDYLGALPFLQQPGSNVNLFRSILDTFQGNNGRDWTPTPNIGVRFPPVNIPGLPTPPDIGGFDPGGITNIDWSTIFGGGGTPAWAGG